MSKVVHRKKRLSSFKLIVLGFAAVIFVGALLLMLPVSSVSGTQTPFHEALFTSVSAVCVTGLVVQDTGCVLYTSPSPRDYDASRMPSSA